MLEGIPCHLGILTVPYFTTSVGLYVTIWLKRPQILSWCFDITYFHNHINFKKCKLGQKEVITIKMDCENYTNEGYGHMVQLHHTKADMLSIPFEATSYIQRLILTQPAAYMLLRFPYLYNSIWVKGFIRRLCNIECQVDIT